LRFLRNSKTLWSYNLHIFITTKFYSITFENFEIFHLCIGFEDWKFYSRSKIFNLKFPKWQFLKKILYFFTKTLTFVEPFFLKFQFFTHFLTCSDFFIVILEILIWKKRFRRQFLPFHWRIWSADKKYYFSWKYEIQFIRIWTQDFCINIQS
jgi:hypothetical protein